MRSYLALYVLLVWLFSIKINAQVPNGDFEQWAGSEPDGWWTNNILVQTISQSSDAHSGSFAARGDVVMTTSGNLQPLLISGEIGGHGFPISERFANLTGYYKLNAVTTENLSVVVIPFKNGQGIGVGGSQFFAASDYTKFTVPIFYSNSSIPDSCQVSLTVGNNSGSVNVGSYFIVDDVVFEGITTDIDETVIFPDSYSLEQNYPNPFNPSTKIRYSIPLHVKHGAANVVLKVYDILGNEVATLVNEEKPAGIYEVEFSTLSGNIHNLSNGVYFYKLQAGEYIETRKMVLLK